MFARLGAALLITTIFAWSSPVLAEPEAPSQRGAAERFAAGEEAYARGDFVRAGDAFEAAYAADPQPASLWNAARSWHRAGERARAANLYRRYIREAPADAPDRDEATRAMLELVERLGRLEIVAPGAGPLSVDGRPAPADVVFVDPGSHLVETSFGADRVQREVTVQEGAAATVLLEKPKPAHAVPSATAPPSQPPVAEKPAVSKGGVTPWVMAPFVGTTALAAALTLASGVDTLIARSEYLDIPPDERTTRQYDEGKFRQDRTNVLIGVTGGLALVSVAVAVFAIDWGEGTLVGLGPTGVRAYGRF
jgi:tetratricopeptide (TPR) repeat protein